MFLLFLIFIAFTLGKDAQTDAKIENIYKSFLVDFEKDVTRTAFQQAQVDFNYQTRLNPGQIRTLDQIYIQHKSESDALFNMFKPIARQIFENAAYNTNFNYYIYNKNLKVWHMYGKMLPNPPIDGLKANQKILGMQLKSAWRTLVR
jgi:hypothetical protein